MVPKQMSPPGGWVWPGVAMLALAVSLIIAGITYGQYRTIKKNERVFTAGIECLLEQQQEHRVTNTEGHEQISDALGKPLQRDQQFGAPDLKVLTELQRKYGRECSRFSSGLVGQR